MGKHLLTSDNLRSEQRLIVIDAYPLFRAGLRDAVKGERNLAIAGELSSVEETYRFAMCLNPTLAIVDIHLPDGSGIEVCRYLVSTCDGLPVIMFSVFDWDVYLAAAWAAGAVAFIPKESPITTLLAAVKQARFGKCFTTKQVNRVRNWMHTIGEPLQRLSEREQQVMGLATRGYTNREMARMLELSEHTIEKHMSSILQTLGVRSRTALLALVLEHHLHVLDDALRMPWN